MALAKAPNCSPRLPEGDLLEPRPLQSNSSSKNKYKSKPCTDFDENSEHADLAEKILQNINAVFDRDELIDEFDIIPAESKANHSPVLHVATEHKLALEAWCVPYLYTHSYKTFLAIRRKQKCSSSTLTTTTTSFPSRYGSFKASNLSESDRISRGLALSRTLVLLNPDVAVAWNFRRDFIPIVSQGVLESELNLVSLVATRKPKCPEGFSYRRWLINEAFKNCLLAPGSIGEWFSVETKSIEIPTLKYFSNYHAWSYRLWLLQKILHDKTVTSEQKHIILERESSFSSLWMNTQVSDYCGHHYRQKLLQLLKTENTTGPKNESLESKLKNELEENINRIKMYEGHESLWCHRRAIMKMLLECLDDNSTAIVDIHDKEKAFVKSIFENLSETSKECMKLNFDHCHKYVKWSNAQFSRFNWQLE